MKRMFGAAAAVLAVVGMGAPAAADNRRAKRHHHRDRDKVDGGDIVIGALILGGILALSSKKASATIEEVAYVPPAEPQPIPEALNADSATDACAEAAEAEGSRLARVVRVDRVSAVDPVGDAWFVKGMLVLRDSYRETGSPRMRGFRCAIAATGMPRVTFDGDADAVF